MKVFRGPLISFNVVKASIIKRKQDMPMVLAFSEYYDYQDVFYRTGPDICAIEPQAGEPDYYKYDFYMTMNLPVEFTSDTKGKIVFEEKLVIEDAIYTRIADNEERYFKGDKDLRHYAENNLNLQLSQKTYFVITERFGEKIIDVYIPIEGGELQE